MSKSLWDEHEINVSLRGFVLRDPNACPEEVLSGVEADDVEAVTEKIKVTERLHNAIYMYVIRLVYFFQTLNVPKLNKLLLYASWKESFKTVEMLLLKGANPNSADGAGRTCLHLSAINGRLDISSSLLKKGARVDTFDKHHLATPLFCAAVADNPDGNLLRI